MDSQLYDHHRTVSDKAHVLVCVVPADTGPTVVKDKTLLKIQDIRREASDGGESPPVEGGAS